MRKLSSLALCAILSSLSPVAFAGSSDSHTVTVTVTAINEVAITGGNVTLTINSATAGSEPDAKQDTSTSLAWTSNQSNKKITVATDQAAPAFSLSATAASVTGGTSAGAVVLSTAAADFVTGIATTTGSCTLQYDASATAADGSGSDVHTVTFTLTDAS